MTDDDRPQPPGHVVLERRGDTAVRLSEPGETGLAPTELPDDRVPAAVHEQEQHHPRWVWDDTARWYPTLLAAGIRVRRSVDLRLGHTILRRSPSADQTLLAGPELAAWDTMPPPGDGEPTLFSLTDHTAALDVSAELERQRTTVDRSTDSGRLRLLLAAESSGALAAAEMTHAGLPWRADVHDRLLTERLGPRPGPGQRPAALGALLSQIRDAFADPELNPDSPAELLAGLQRAGLDLTDTRAWTLERLDHPGTTPLVAYKKLQRLHQANGWQWLDRWVRDGRYRPDYRPGGVVTGRWAAHGGGALSLPGQLRPAVVADPGWRLVVADVAQLEPRVLAGMSADEAMAEAARSRDLYQAMVDAGVVRTRPEAKLAMIGAMYGATTGESGRMITRMTRRYPRAVGLVEDAARAGERGEAVRTLLGRGSPVPTGAWVDRAPEQASEAGSDARESRAWGRFTRNFVVQGTGAEWALCWLASLRNRLWELTGSGCLTDGPHLVFFLHDEVVVHTPAALADDVVDAVHAAAAEAGRLLFGSFPLDFPLDVAVVGSYADAG